MKKKVLFLYLTKGSGHAAVASALRTALRMRDPNVECKELDFLSNTLPTIGTTLKKAYLWVLQTFPDLGSYLYDNSVVKEATSGLRDIFIIFKGRGLRTRVMREHPDIIVCTQAIPCHVLAAQKEIGKLTVPLVAVVTDFSVHSYWIHPAIDKYFVPSEDVADEFVRRGVTRSKIIIIGIPVHPNFLTTISQKDARKKIGIHPTLPTVLLMGGSYGFGAFEEALEEIARAKKKFQVIVVTGKNQELHDVLRRRWAGRRSFKILGYTKSVPLLMDASDILIGKPGGSTVAEALTKGLPIVVFDPFPGPEARNAEYLVRHRAAVEIAEISELVPKIEELLSVTGELSALRACAHRLGTPRSAFSGADNIMKIARGAGGKAL